MSSFEPPDFPDFEFPEGDGSTTVALVSTMDPVSLAVDEVDDDRIPDGDVCMGSFLEGRLIARRAVPPEILEDMRTQQTFSSPVRIALAAVEQDPGLQCRLFALLPAEQMQEDDEAHEPWAESVPKFEDTGTDEEMDDAEDAVVPILLGHIVRFTKDRKHPEDLAAEAADVLQTIIADDQPLSNVVDKLLDDL